MGTHDLYEMSLMSFEEWADYVEHRWRGILSKKLGADGTKVAMRIHMPMLAGCAHEAYEEYRRCWRRNRDQQLRSLKSKKGDTV